MKLLTTTDDDGRTPDHEYPISLPAKKRNGSGVAQSEFEKADKFNGQFTDVFTKPEPDKLHPRVLKELATELGTVFAHLFQQSIDTGEIPSEWSLANICPLFKKGDRSLVCNYRPVPWPAYLVSTRTYCMFKYHGPSS